MSDSFGAVSLVVMAALLGAVAASLALGSPLGRLGPDGENFRGFRIPVSLGMALITAVVVTRLMVLGVIGVSGGSLGLSLVAQLGAVALAFLGGLHDDLQTDRPHGIAKQVAMLAQGRVAPGIVKLVAALGAGAVAIAAVGGDGFSYLVGVPMIAGFANLWNLFDVRPGRALKLFVPAAVIVGALAWPSQSMLLTAVTAGAAAALLPADLGERGMLGDRGAYVLGVVVGIGIYDSVGHVGLVVALGVVVLLHVLSETVSLSRLIRGIPPLRWADEVGRIHPVEPEPEPLAPPEPVPVRGAGDIWGDPS
jgi:UDP-GlcNAc:undecaprenyl-phosphate GlcNAc-1-phosphate transferase